MKSRFPRAFFISYSRKDADIVHPVVQMMRATGTQVFRDEDNISPGKRWRDVLSESLRDADVIVVFWSKNSAESAAVAAEYHEGVSLGKDIIPVLLDDQPLSSVLKEYQYIDFRPMTGMGSPWFTILQCLADSILRRVGNRPNKGNTLVISTSYDVFIAHTANGTKEATQYSNEFRIRSLTVLQWSIPPGDSILLSSEVYLQMRDSRVVLLVVTPNDLHNPQIADIGTALAYMPTRGHPILVNCEHAELPGDLRMVQAYSSRNRSEWQDHLNQWIRESKENPTK